jgi:Mitochondrial calcium uniporter
MALRSYLLKTSHFIRIQGSESQAFPYFTLPGPRGSESFNIDPVKSLRDLKHEISSKFNTTKIDFFGLDGSKISASSSLISSLKDPLFIKIEDHKMYTLYNSNTHQIYLNPYQRTLAQQYEKEKGLSRDEAEVIGAFNYFILHELQDYASSEITPDAFSLIVKNAILQYGVQAMQQKNLLEKHLELLKIKYSYELEAHNEAHDKALQHGQKMHKRFFYIILAQFALVQYGTYHLYSWDIMEPITCMMSMGDLCLGYLFWMLFGNREYGIEGINSYFFDRKYKKILKRKKLTVENISEINRSIKDLEDRIKNI